MSDAKHLVFVSYAAEDKAIADAVCAAIESVGVPCWIAPRDIVTGSNWAKSIMQGISNSKLMVLIFSKQTNASPHVRREIERAVHHDVPIAPLRVEDILPEEDLEYFLSSQHWSDLFPGPVEQRVREIPDKVCRLLGVTPVAPKPPPPLPAREAPAAPVDTDSDSKPPAAPVEPTAVVAPVRSPASKPPPLPVSAAPQMPAAPPPASSAPVSPAPFPPAPVPPAPVPPAPVSPTPVSTAPREGLLPRVPAGASSSPSFNLFSWRNIAIVSGGLLVLLIGLILLGWHLESKDSSDKSADASDSSGSSAQASNASTPNTPAPVVPTKELPPPDPKFQPPIAQSPGPDLSSLPRQTANSLFMKFVLIAPGTFTMGDDSGFADEKPAHRVTITHAFYMQECEITQGHWMTVMGTTPQQQRDVVNPNMSMPGAGDNLPMYFVSWDDARRFCMRLSSIEGKTYRLPTEAEWEYACRGGSNGSYCFGSRVNQLDNYGWSTSNASGLVHQVEDQSANAWGLYDMHGNVWEWCADFYDKYLPNQATDPTGPAFTIEGKHVLRGGSWASKPSFCRSAIRLPRAANIIGNDAGFRVVMEIR